MQIIEALKILADSPDNQVAYLEELGTSPSTDELALQFSDTYQVYRARMKDRCSDSLRFTNVLLKLDCIDQMFDKMGNMADSSRWNVSSLGNEEWAEVRKRAAEVLPLILDLEV